jgi:GNAT superfamily N-acetyltransferase
VGESVQGSHSKPELRAAGEVELRPGSGLQYLLDHLESSHRVLWLVVDDRVVAGVRLDLRTGATGADVIGPNVVVETLAVETDERRKGYGRAVMQAVEHWLRGQSGLPPALSLGVRGDDRVAITIYESLGYRPLLDSDANPVVLPVDYFVMYKHLAR